MPKFLRKPIIHECSQWFKLGDHSEVRDIESAPLWVLPPTGPTCTLCTRFFGAHGFIRTLEGGHIVCPGDWIVKGVNGEHWAVKPNIFEKTYVSKEDAAMVLHDMIEDLDSLV